MRMARTSTNPKSASVKASREAAGVKSTSVYLTEDERDRWERLAARLGLNKTETLRAAFDALEARGEPTPEEALRVLAKVVRGRR
jgi:hypothetical protein